MLHYHIIVGIIQYSDVPNNKSIRENKHERLYFRVKTEFELLVLSFHVSIYLYIVLCIFCNIEYNTNTFCNKIYNFFSNPKIFTTSEWKRIIWLTGLTVSDFANIVIRLDRYVILNKANI